MKGEMTIKATEHGFGIDMDFSEVSNIDKFELLHSVATGLQMNRAEMRLFCHLELSGVLRDAELVTHCEDDVQMDRMLQGEGPKHHQGVSTDYVMNELRNLLEKMGGHV